MRWSAALTPSRPSALGVAFACAIACGTMTMATGTVQARPTKVPAVSPRPAERSTGAKTKPVAIATPVAEPAPAARGELVQHRWPNVPLGHQLSMSEQITDRLTEIGNRFGDHLDLLSRDMFQLKVDGRRRRAHVRLGGGGGADDLVTFQIDGEIQFDDLNARVDTHIDLGVGGHLLSLSLPEFQVQTDEYRGDYGVQLEVPVFERRF